MNTIPNRKAICDILISNARENRDIVALCSDSRGSASMTPFFEQLPEQSIEVGIAEQNLVGISAGLAKGGKKPFAFSPACFITTRSYEQVKIDVAYSNTDVKLIGISGGISYGELGMSHHSLQDIAAMSALPNMRVYLPSDRFQTAKLVSELLNDKKPAYVRVGRNPVEDIYDDACSIFAMDKAIVHGTGTDVLVVACGEMVAEAIEALKILKEQGINGTVVDMFCVKPLDEETLLRVSQNVKLIVTVEEHSRFGGMGSMVCQLFAEKLPKKVLNFTLPDKPIIAGKSKDVFKYYRLDSHGIADRIMESIK